MSTKYLDSNGLSYLWGKLKNYFQPKLVSGTNIKTINNESLLGSGDIESGDPKNVWYGTCSTGASTQAKVATTDGGDFVLAKGNIVVVKFDNGNTYNGIATLNVDGTSAISIHSVAGTTTSRYYWKSNEVVAFVYTGSVFVMLEKAPATTTYYGITKLSSSTTSTSESLSATPKAVKTAYDLAKDKQDALVSGTNIKTINGNSVLGSGDLTLPIPAKTSDLTNDSDFVSDASYVHTDNNFTTAEKNKLSGIQAGAEVNVQSDWDQTDSSADDYIKNKPTIPTPPSPTSTTPIMDGTADVGSETNYARGDHVHPSDTSKQDTLVSGTNIKTVNGNSLLGSGNIVIPGGGGTSDYDSLTNRPQINSVTLTGNKSFADLGLIDFFYPVGSYYETSDSSFDPNVTWGGTWVLEADGLVHIGAGNRYPVGDTGGEETHTLTVNEMPAHAHNTKGEYVYYGSGSNAGTILLWANGSAAVQQTGGNVPHNIMQPYIAVNRWHRTA